MRLLKVVNSGVEILNISASAEPVAEASEVSVSLEIDLVVPDSDPFIGAALYVMGGGVKIKVLGASSILFPIEGKDASEISPEDLAELLREHPIAVHNLYDALATAGRTAAGLLMRFVEIPQSTPEATVSIMRMSTEDDTQDESS